MIIKPYGPPSVARILNAILTAFMYYRLHDISAGGVPGDTAPMSSNAAASDLAILFFFWVPANLQRIQRHIFYRNTHLLAAIYNIYTLKENPTHCHLSVLHTSHRQYLGAIRISAQFSIFIPN